jgi:small conductance mechanosensitive channel
MQEMQEMQEMQQMQQTPAPTTADTAKKAGAAVGVLAAAAVVLVLVNLLMVPRPPINFACEEDARKVARVNTVMAGLKSAITVVVILVAMFLAMGVSGVNTKALLVSAGVVGLVIGFGAQSIIRSFIAGLVLLSSNRFNLGDLVRLDILGVNGGDSGAGAVLGASAAMDGTKTTGAAFGIVRGFSLLTTTLQDIRGAQTYVSNGNIMLVTNYSQNPQRATVLLHIDSSQSPQAITEGLEEFVASMAFDDPLKDKVLRPPIVKGITANGDNTYVFAVTALAHPASTLFVERHMRQRLLQYLHTAGIAPGSSAVVRDPIPAKQ